tara:strand:+ start:664 stop:2613 length:1950 start_codon:yes stop_codon:yes gene_type:complete
MATEDNQTRNPQSTLFKRLTRLLSGPLVNFRVQSPRKEKRYQLDKYKFRSASGKQFKKTSYDPFENLTSNIMSNQNRIERYGDFEQMEYEPIIASAMDIYADEMTTSNEFRKLLTIKCPNDEIKDILDNLYYGILNIEFNLFGWCRSMCKFGDYIMYLDIDEEAGVRNAIGLPSGELERMEGADPENPNYVQFQWNSGGLTFENWQVAHFRILGNDKYAPYGTSVLEPARRIWRQLTLLEDAMMAYRIVRAPERRAFYIDVGGIAPEDVEQFMQKAMTQMKRNQVVDANTGRVDLRYNPLSIEEDYFIPVRGGESGTKIEAIAGQSRGNDIEDVKYLKDKLFAAIKVPQAYLFRGEDAEEDKTTLAQKDIRFARTIQRLQRSIVSELEKIGIVHLFTLGYRSHDLVSFKLSLNNPSKIAELQELENWRTKFETANAATEGFFSKRWISENMFDMSEDEFLRNQREMFYDRKFESALETVGEEAVAGEASLGGGELGGADLGGELGGAELGGEELGGEELGGEGEGEALAPEEGGGEEERTAILPAKRDERTSYEKAKGHRYKPVNIDKRGMGARRRSYRSQYSYETGKNTRRNTHKGLSDLLGLGRGISEEKDTTYNEELKLFEINQQVRDLITELESKNNETKTQQET